MAVARRENQTLFVSPSIALPLTTRLSVVPAGARMPAVIASPQMRIFGGARTFTAASAGAAASRARRSSRRRVRSTWIRTYNDVLLSAAVVWEVAIRRSLGKLDIPDGFASALLAG